MRLWFSLLAVVAMTAILSGAETTNMVEILRQFQAELDAQEGRLPRGVEVKIPAEDRGARATPGAVVYRLRPGDRLRVEVAGEPAMSVTNAAVASEGTLTLPIVGPVAVAGKTVEEATRLIREILDRDYLVDPRVVVQRLEADVWPEEGAASVRAVEGASATPAELTEGQHFFSVTNQVTRPGRYPWPGEGITLRRAIELAGGATSRADLSRVMVRRRIAGEPRQLEVNLARPASSRRGGSLLIQPGDEVEVPSK